MCVITFHVRSVVEHFRKNAAKGLIVKDDIQKITRTFLSVEGGKRA